MSNHDSNPAEGRPLGDRSRPGAAPPERDLTPDMPNENTLGHRHALGPLPIGTPSDDDKDVPRRPNERRGKHTRRQHYPDLTDYIRQLVDEAPPLDEEQRARLGRILRAHIPKQRTEPPRDAAA